MGRHTGGKGISWSPDGTKDNPYPPNGPRHNVNQAFVWSEPHPCQGGQTNEVLEVRCDLFIIAQLGVSIYLVRAFWCTRESALVGAYKAEGAWGSSTLVLGADHMFQQSASFTNQFNGKSEGSKSTSGRWVISSRTLLSQKLELSSFINLSPSAIKRKSETSIQNLGLLAHPVVSKSTPGQAFTIGNGTEPSDISRYDATHFTYDNVRRLCIRLQVHRQRTRCRIRQ